MRDMGLDGNLVAPDKPKEPRTAPLAVVGDSEGRANTIGHLCAKKANALTIGNR